MRRLDPPARRRDPVIRERSTTISPDRSTVFAFDLEGRPVSWFERDRVFKRSLASVIYGRERIGGRKKYWRLSDEDAVEAFDRILRAVAHTPLDRLDEQGIGRIERILSWTPERLAAERERFDAAYRPISILPPDQYLAVVLQATFGCSWNRCTFCSFYQDQPFSTRAESDFRKHCQDVGELLGRGAELRRRIFLADGNSLTLSNRRLLPVFETAREFFPGRELYGFVDVFAGEKKSLDDWSELLGAGLKRVYVGIETGDDRLLGWLNKPGSAGDALEFVQTLKQAALRVSAILMVGVGGERFASDHLRRSLELTARLPLDAGDVVYLSPFLEREGSVYARLARDERLRALDADEIDSQYLALRDGIRRANPRIRVTRYDIREFVY